MLSKASYCLWDEMCKKKVGYTEIVLVWIVPVLIWIPVWLENTQFGTGNGSNGGYMCHPKENGKLVIMTTLERNYFLVTD